MVINYVQKQGEGYKVIYSIKDKPFSDHRGDTVIFPGIGETFVVENVNYNYESMVITVYLFGNQSDFIAVATSLT